jgi:hypothetical protein
MSDNNHIVVVPNIEEDIPLPKNAVEAFPNLTVEEEIEVRSNTIKLVSDIAGENIEPTKENQEKAKEIAKEMITNPKLRPEFANYPNETIAFLAGLVAQSNHMIVQDLADLKLHVVNNLVKEAEMAKSSRERIAALKAIGEIDGVDAFKRKTEITHISKSGDELEKELRETIEQLKGKIVEGEVIDEVDK